MSICRAISGTFGRAELSRFEESFADPAIREMTTKSASVGSVLQELASQPLYEHNYNNHGVGTDVIQVVPNGYGYTVKVSAAPQQMAPQQTQMTGPEAQASGVPPQMLQQADQQGVATVTGVEAAPDPMVETPAPATGFGMYKVLDLTSGKQIIGFVIPNLFDPRTGQPAGMSLFTNGSSFAIQPEIHGVLTGINFNLPAADIPRGMGIFYKTDGKTLMATIPFSIENQITVEGKTHYAAKTQEGLPIQLQVSDGLQRPVAISPTEVIIPADFQFLPLDNPVQLEGGMGANLMKVAQAEALHTMGEFRAGDGWARLSGPVFQKVGSGEHSWEDALFYMAASGLQQNVAMPLLTKSASTGEAITLYGLAPLSDRSQSVQQTKEAMANLASLLERFIPADRNLLKEASALSLFTFEDETTKEAASLIGTETVDSMLSLNFLNPLNVEVFVDNIPKLKETSEKLAEVVLACQVGLKGVPKEAAVRSMQALESVIDGLLGIKKYTL